MSYIDQDATVKALLAMEKNASERGKAVIQMCIRKVLGMFPADVVPVVRCKNCKHYDTGIYGAEEMICTFWAEHLETNPDDFCSYGERRDSDG